MSLPSLDKFRLNARNRDFTLRVWTGQDKTSAYLDVYRNGARPKVNSKDYCNAATCASRLSKKAKVAAALEFLHSVDETKAALTRNRKREVLADVVEGRREATTTEALAAIRIDNEMTGHNAPVQVEADIQVSSILDIVVGAQHEAIEV